jgi:hypothetical protein
VLHRRRLRNACSLALGGGALWLIKFSGRQHVLEVSPIKNVAAAGAESLRGRLSTGQFDLRRTTGGCNRAPFTIVSPFYWNQTPLRDHRTERLLERRFSGGGISMGDAEWARNKHEPALLKLPHVLGVGVGRDDETGQDTIVVFVDRKIPSRDLRAEEVIPQSVDGVPIRIKPIGQVEAEEA